MNDLKRSATCRNCQVPIKSDDKFCACCGQKNTDGRIPVWTFITDFFSNIFNLDSKLVKTAGALFIPGKLTVEYFKGRHKSFTSPVRLFLFMGITLFALVVWKTQDVDLGLDPSEYPKRAEQVRLKRVLKEKITTFKTSFFPDTTEHFKIDSLQKSILAEFYSTPDNDSIVIPANFGMEKSRKISSEDFVDMSIDEILEKYEIPKGGFEAYALDRQITMMKNGKGVFHYFLGKLPIMLFLMMPFLALLLKLLYVRRKQFFVEHLVFSFHYHTFAFVITMILVLFGKYFSGLLIAALIVLIFVYQFIAMKRFYGQGYIKTFFKFWLINSMYMFLVVAFFSLAVLVSIALF